MKEKLFTLALAFSCLTSTGQTNTSVYAPWSNPPLEFYSPMWNALSTNCYYGTSNVTNFGTQLDTFCTGCKFVTLKLSTVRNIQKDAPSNDTLVPSAIYGNGKISVRYQTWKATTTNTVVPTVVATLYSSNDFYSWAPVSGLSAQTTNPSSVFTTTVVPTSNGWDGVTKSNLYYGIWFTATGDTASASAQIYSLKDAQYQLTK